MYTIFFDDYKCIIKSVLDDNTGVHYTLIPNLEIEKSEEKSIFEIFIKDIQKNK